MELDKTKDDVTQLQMQRNQFNGSRLSSAVEHVQEMRYRDSKIPVYSILYFCLINHSIIRLRFCAGRFIV